MRRPVDGSRAHWKSAPAELVSRFTTVPLGYVAAIVMAALLGLTLVDVVLRKTRGRGIDGTVEYTETLLVIGVFVSLAFAQRSGNHIATSVVTSKVPRAAARLLNAVVGAFGAAVLAVTVFATWDRFMHAMERAEYTMGVARVDLWPARLAVAVGLGIYLFEYLRAIHHGPSRKTAMEEGLSEYDHEVKRAEND